MATKSLCSIDGCDNPRNAKGYCRNHYYRFWKHGDPLAGRTAQGEPLAWLENHKAYAGEDCLIWPYATFQNGYAVAVVDGRTTHASHVMCTLAHGEPKPETPFSLHSCGGGANACVHPQHLRWGTQAENMEDSVLAGTRCRGEDQHAAKLTENDVRQIRLLRGVIMQKEIAARFKVDPETVRRIQKRTAWAWLE